MKLRNHLTISMALAALTLGFTATQASAQPVLKGSFELPAAAYWGDTLLQPGIYNISMSTNVHDLEHVTTIRVSGEGITRTFLSSSRPKQGSLRNYLTVGDIGGAYVVRAFDSGSIGRSFAFGVTRSVRTKMLRARAGSLISIPVSAEAGF